MTQRSDPPEPLTKRGAPTPGRRSRSIKRGIAALVIVVSAFLAMDQLLTYVSTLSGDGAVWIVAAALLAYALLICVPFLPSLHMSMTFIALRGPDEAWMIFAATLLGFFLPYLYGRFVRASLLAVAFHDLGMHRAARVVEHAAPLSPAERLASIQERAPVRWRGFLTRWRYLSLAVALNVPGNVLIGGAGGILMMAGLSRLFSPLPLLLTLIVVLLPFPILVTVFNIDLSNWLRSGL